jgi:hypothetical protein
VCFRFALTQMGLGVQASCNQTQYSPYWHKLSIASEHWDAVMGHLMEVMHVECFKKNWVDRIVGFFAEF